MASMTMLVRKKDLGRANGMLQIGQAIGMVITALIAGLLFVAIGITGILTIDFVTFLFASGRPITRRVVLCLTIKSFIR